MLAHSPGGRRHALVLTLSSFIFLGSALAAGCGDSGGEGGAGPGGAGGQGGSTATQGAGGDGGSSSSAGGDGGSSSSAGGDGGSSSSAGGDGGSSSSAGGDGGSSSSAGGEGSGCTSADECPGTDTECQKRTCEAGRCGLSFMAQGTPLSLQKDGDCKRVVCNGMGGTTEQDDDNDVLDDGNECTVDTCDAGVASNAPADAGAPCSAGGTRCDGDGACVECLDGGDCASGICDEGRCSVATCTDSVKNGRETGKDCGGPDCGPCADGEPCVASSDCASTICQDHVCKESACGDGIVVAPEQCDDGNLVSGDGCSDACADEPRQVVTAGPGLNTSIPDDAYNGTLASMGCVDLVVPPAESNTVASVEVQLGITHTWLGDLVIKLVSPSNTVVTLMSRPQCPETADDGALLCNQSSNLSAEFPITFKMGAATSAEDMAVPVGTSGSTSWVVCQRDQICEYAPHSGAAAAGDLTAFVGQPSNGTWRLCVGDAGPGETGTIDLVKLTIGK